MKMTTVWTMKYRVYEEQHGLLLTPITPTAYAMNDILSVPFDTMDEAMAVIKHRNRERELVILPIMIAEEIWED